jgi:hypothetical protein
MRPLAAAAVLCAALGLLAHPAGARAATPCWKALLTDWYDGRIDDTYPLHCYRDALHHLPPDVQTYSSARDDILRALQSARATIRRTGTHESATTPIPPQTTPRTPTTSGPTVAPTGPPTTAPQPLPGRRQKGGLSQLADRLNPSSPEAFPLPLLVLGALALLLVAAGGAGLLAKRLQGRKPAP